jgi:transposase
VIHPSSVAVSREHRRAKTDRLDTELLKRGFLGWLRGERGHCSMARVPTMAEEDAKRPNRELECLVGERTRIVNRMKATLARLGVCNFKPTLRRAAERLATVHTPEGMPLPPNVLAELQREERCEAAGTRPRQSRQCKGAPRRDPTRLALSAVSEAERTGTVVPGAHCR